MKNLADLADMCPTTVWYILITTTPVRPVHGGVPLYHLCPGGVPVYIYTDHHYSCAACSWGCPTSLPVSWASVLPVYTLTTTTPVQPVPGCVPLYHLCPWGLEGLYGLLSTRHRRLHSLSSLRGESRAAFLFNPEASSLVSFPWDCFGFFWGGGTGGFNFQ